ncbi:UNVERIFIED_CONTAM: hypothetical protein NCL1_12049 [Trichonephila clavipes]
MVKEKLRKEVSHTVSSWNCPNSSECTMTGMVIYCDCGRGFNCTFSLFNSRRRRVNCICTEGYYNSGGSCYAICNSTHPCQNGGTCQDGRCKCMDRTWGDFCEDIEGCGECTPRQVVDCVYDQKTKEHACLCKSRSLEYDYIEKVCKPCPCGEGICKYTRPFVKLELHCDCNEGYKEFRARCKTSVKLVECQGPRRHITLGENYLTWQMDRRISRNIRLKAFNRLSSSDATITGKYPVCRECKNWPIYWLLDSPRKDCRTLSAVSFERYHLVLLPLQRQPVPIRCVCQQLIEFLPECDCGPNSSCEIDQKTGERICKCEDGFVAREGRCIGEFFFLSLTSKILSLLKRNFSKNVI